MTGLNCDAESTWMLDQAWHRVNSLGGTFMKGDLVAKGYCEAINACLAVIEELGGMDPLQRGHGKMRAVVCELRPMRAQASLIEE